MEAVIAQRVGFQKCTQKPMDFQEIPPKEAEFLKKHKDYNVFVISIFALLGRSRGGRSTSTRWFSKMQ